MKFTLLIASTLCVCIGLWNHDWTLIVASCLLALAWIGIAEEVANVKRERELDSLWEDDDDLPRSA